MKDHPATIVIVDPGELSRSSLREALEMEPDLMVVGETADPDAGLQRATESLAELVIIAETIMRPGDGFELCSRIHLSGCQAHVLMLLDQQDAQQILTALEHGAMGAVTRHDRLAEFLQSTRAAIRGEACVPRRLLGGVLSGLIHRRRRDVEVAQRYGRLSRREREVLALLSQGHDNRDISLHLVISPQTTRSHIQSILDKMEVHSRLEAVNLAVEHGLCETDGKVDVLR
jgi:DNA-binding NarL/FixJ family response regulator